MGWGSGRYASAGNPLESPHGGSLAQSLRRACLDSGVLRAESGLQRADSGLGRGDSGLHMKQLGVHSWHLGTESPRIGTTPSYLGSAPWHLGPTLSCLGPAPPYLRPDVPHLGPVSLHRRPDSPRLTGETSPLPRPRSGGGCAWSTRCDSRVDCARARFLEQGVDDKHIPVLGEADSRGSIGGRSSDHSANRRSPRQRVCPFTAVCSAE
jgi:hypothetical protein